MKLGVITDCFKLPPKSSIQKAAEMGFDGIQLYATTGEFSPERLTAADKKEYKGLIRDSGLVVSALCGDMGGFGFQIEEDNPERVKKTKRIIDLAREFEAPVVTTHIGVIPKDRDVPRYAVMLRALSECGAYARSQGVMMAIETGPEDAPTLLQFINDTDGGVGVNLDPANFVMVTGQDPVEAVYLLRDHIVHTHAKDGIMLKRTDPQVIYDSFAVGGIEALNFADCLLETPLGQGHVDFPVYLRALREIGYDGFLTIERETGDNPEADIALAKTFLNNLLV